MAPRRASARGASLRQLLPGLRTRSRAAALVAAALLLPAATLPAATHSTHAHHAPGESAGKASAHAVHETGHDAGHETGHDAATRAAHAQAKSSNNRSSPSSSATRKGAPVPKHASQPHPGPADKRGTGTHSGRKHHEQQPADDPQPVYRAGAERHTRGGRETSAEERRTPSEARAISARGSVHEASARVASGRPAPGLAVHDSVRASHQHGSSANLRSTAAVDPAEATDALSAANTELQRAAADAHASAVTAVVVANALSQSAPPTAVIEGFGAEVAFHGTATRPAHAPAVVLPRETPAEQERDLRAAADIAGQPMFVPLYARGGNLIVPPPLKGSRDILVHQNQMADDAGLTRIQDEADLDRLRRARLLVDFPESASLRVNEGLPENRRSARPWTVKFATDIAHAFYAHFGEPLQVNSAVRTVAYQLRLQRTNGNAAAIDGEGASPHLTGQALDFGKRGMSVAEIAWMRSYLVPLIDAGKIDVEEEFQQACFHISVYASYAPAPKIHAAARTEVAQVSRTTHTHSAGDTDDNLR